MCADPALRASRALRAAWPRRSAQFVCVPPDQPRSQGATELIVLAQNAGDGFRISVCAVRPGGTGGTSRPDFAPGAARAIGAVRSVAAVGASRAWRTCWARRARSTSELIAVVGHDYVGQQGPEIRVRCQRCRDLADRRGGAIDARFALWPTQFVSILGVEELDERFAELLILYDLRGDRARIG